MDAQIRNDDDPLELERLSVRHRGLIKARDDTAVQRELEETPEEREERLSVRSAQEEDIGRLEKIKEWAKENMVGLAAVGISIAGIVTTIVVAGRKATFQGAKAVGAFGKFVAKVAMSLGALLTPLLSVLITIISWGAKGLLWLSKNLWVLVVSATYFAYDYCMKKVYIRRYEY